MTNQTSEAFDRASKAMTAVSASMGKAADAAREAVAVMNAHRDGLEAERKQLLAELRDLSTPDAFLAMPSRDRQKQLQQLSADYLDVLQELYTEVVIGTENGEGFAYLGPSAHEGVAFHVKVSKRPGESKQHAQRRSAMQAYSLLLDKLKRTTKNLPFKWQ